MKCSHLCGTIFATRTHNSITSHSQVILSTHPYGGAFCVPVWYILLHRKDYPVREMKPRIQDRIML